MSRLPWPELRARQSRVHLLAVVQVDQPASGPRLQEVQRVLQRLVRGRHPAGDYATTIVREAGRPAVYRAFADEGDARKFAAELHAVATDSYPGWATQRAVHLDGATVKAFAASLPLPKTRPKQPREPGQTSQLSVRYGYSRAPRSRTE
jgi:hypothetical protein